MYVTPIAVLELYLKLRKINTNAILIFSHENEIKLLVQGYLGHLGKTSC